MKPRGQLMIEHRLIEKMLKAIQNQLSIIAEQNRVDPIFVDTVVDFVKIYADRTHHGKEEDILFRDLSTKRLTPEDKKTMAELIEEHEFGRQVTFDLVKAGKDYRNGRVEALQTIVEKLSLLKEFYPKHIIKEDKIFFPNTEQYFSQEEQEKMLDEFREFDRKMIHEKYISIVENMK
ncbi:MAG: hemerythrin domain-containing protein [Desulfobacterales bacterium]